MAKQTLLIDFDGVLHTYDGTFSNVLNMPVPGARKACIFLSREYKLICFTTRKPTEDVERWLSRNGFPVMEVTDVKKPAYLILDDRALRFDGQWTDELLAQIYNFKPWWKVGEPTT